MGEAQIKIGKVSKNSDGSFLGQLEHTYDGHTREQLWRMLTEPKSLAQWLAEGTIEQKQGGKVKIDFADSGILIDSTVLEIQDQQVLAYSWSSGDEPSRPLRWQIDEVPNGVKLSLAATIPANEDPAKAYAGFEGHLAMLAGALEGVPLKFPFQLFLDARAAYTEAVKSL